MKFLSLLFSALLGVGLATCGPGEPFHTDLGELTDQLNELGNNDLFSGTILLAVDDSIVLRRSYGLANVETETPITEATRFNLASMGKMFTAVATLQLRDARKLALDDLVGTYLPGYPNAAVRDSVTIRHLLTHTSGLGDFFNERFERMAPDSLQTLEGYLNLFQDDPLGFPPGDRFAYSNAGYIVLGLVIARAAGTDYYSLVRQRIFEPLDMTDTGWTFGDETEDGLAIAYYTQDSTGTWLPNPYLGAAGTSAGGGYSTADDLYTFAKALRDGQLISPETLAEMTDDAAGNGYGYGLSLREFNGIKLYGHNGGFPGVAGEVDIIPSTGVIAVSLSNRSPRSGWATARSLVREALVGPNEDSAGHLNAESVAATHAEKGLAAAREELLGYAGEVSERQLMSYAEALREAGKPDDAREFVSLVVEAFPESWFPVSILADLQLEMGDTTTAVTNYQRSLELEAGNQWARDRLGELGY